MEIEVRVRLLLSVQKPLGPQHQENQQVTNLCNLESAEGLLVF